MSSDRQKTFLKLKAPCVHLSSVALSFRTNNAPVKDVLRALEGVRDVLKDLGESNLLDAKLAEYAFFPLAQQVFNESKRLSPRCLEVAIECVTFLVRYGYRRNLQPALGKQLLILMSMLAGGGPDAKAQTPPDELKAAAFQCIRDIVGALHSSPEGKAVFEDQGTKNIVDQLTYVLSEAITNATLELAQLLASLTLQQLTGAISSRVFLASILPRTISALVKTLKSSTKIRRTQRVMVANLGLFRGLVKTVLSDKVIDSSSEDDKQTLDESWLKATTSQIRNALLQVCKLRTHEGASVRKAVEELCNMVIEECHTTLGDSIAIALDTLIVLSASPDSFHSTRLACRHIVICYPDTAELLRSNFVDSSQSLPRIMQGQDEGSKQSALLKLSAMLPLLSETGLSVNDSEKTFLKMLVRGVASMLQEKSPRIASFDEPSASMEALVHTTAKSTEFGQVVLTHQSQQATKSTVMRIVEVLQHQPNSLELAKSLCDMVIGDEGESRLASFWLVLQLLRDPSASVDDFLEDVSEGDHVISRSQLLADLHANTFPTLSSVFDSSDDWHIQALSIETLVLYAETFPGDSYRPELVETLYPVLAFLASPNALLRAHSTAALNKLAKFCQYTSVQDLLVQNADYLVNSIAWKLNTYNLSPEAPQLLRMMVLLCGAEIVPYVDDLVQLIFAGLHNFHGYPEWVELLFSSLKSLVDVSVKQPLAITQGVEPKHVKQATAQSTCGDILDDLRARKRRKLESERPADEAPSSAPRRAWTDALNGPSFPKTEDVKDYDTEQEDEGHLAPMKPSEDEEKKLSKAYTLLLSIATSTVPHMASPSPRVRHLLLDLLKDMCPLLSRDENSFLPLVNAVWPVVVPRLFADIDRSEELGYNVAAAADTIALLCINAGDFMSSRIEEISDQLCQLVESVQKQVHRSETTKSAKGLIEPVDTLIVDSSKGTGRSADQQLIPEPQMRTSSMQVSSALTNLLSAIISHVRLTHDARDQMIRLLLPRMQFKEEIRQVLETANSDMVWLYDLEQGAPKTSHQARNSPAQMSASLGLIDSDNGTGAHAKPSLREHLLAMGYVLTPLQW